VWLRYVSVAATTLLAFFFAMMLVQYVRGATIDCGCFGVGEALSMKTLARDFGLVLTGAALAWLSRRPSIP
jgi:hypothetical protein